MVFRQIKFVNHENDWKYATTTDVMAGTLGFAFLATDIHVTRVTECTRDQACNAYI